MERQKIVPEKTEICHRNCSAIIRVARSQHDFAILERHGLTARTGGKNDPMPPRFHRTRLCFTDQLLHFIHHKTLGLSGMSVLQVPKYLGSGEITSYRLIIRRPLKRMRRIAGRALLLLMALPRQLFGFYPRRIRGIIFGGSSVSSPKASSGTPVSYPYALRSLTAYSACADLSGMRVSFHASAITLGLPH